MSAAKASTTSRATRAKGAASGAGKAAAKAAAGAAGSAVGGKARWTEEQVSLLLETVTASSTAKEAFESVARKLGKSTGTVQQKYYNLQKKNGGGSTSGRKRGRPVGSRNARPAGAAASRSATAPSGTAAGALPGSQQLRTLSVDELVGLARLVKTEVDRRKQELDAASKVLAG